MILHNSVSLNGRADGYQGGIGQFYQVASAFQADAMLSRSNTLLVACESAPPAEEPPAEPAAALDAAPEEDDTRALLVVPDSRGHVPPLPLPGAGLILTRRHHLPSVSSTWSGSEVMLSGSATS
ncbi:MAG: hypothetical protein ACP5JJ_00160 [Anaerolineae bacterium]